jgi:hypothetical protein
VIHCAEALQRGLIELKEDVHLDSTPCSPKAFNYRMIQDFYSAAVDRIVKGAAVIAYASAGDFMRFSCMDGS